MNREVTPDLPTDACLVRLARDGGDAAFTELIRRHKSWLFRFIRRYVGNDDDSLDVLQDSMIATWKALDRFDPERNFQAWLRQIALNKCRDWNRRGTLRRIVGYVARDIDGFAAESRSSEPEYLLNADEALRSLDQSIASLPRSLREPFILSAFEGLSQRETAQLLRVSEKAVETRIYRARQRLAKTIDRSDLGLLLVDPTQ